MAVRRGRFSDGKSPYLARTLWQYAGCDKRGRPNLFPIACWYNKQVTVWLCVWYVRAKNPLAKLHVQTHKLYITFSAFWGPIRSKHINEVFSTGARGAQWLSGRVLDSRPKGRGFEPHRRHCVVVFKQDTFILAYTTFTNLSTIYLVMCKVYTDVGGIK